MIHTNFDLKPYNTFGISVKADRYAAFSSIEELQMGSCGAKQRAFVDFRWWK